MRQYLFLGIVASTIAVVPLRARAQTPVRAPQGTPASPSSSQSDSSSGSFDPIDTRIVSDPLYLPAKGQLYGVTAYTLDKPQGDNDKAGVQTGSFRSSDNLIDQTLDYGVTNDFVIRAVMGYGVNERDSTAAATGDVTTGNANGFTDPTFSATYRLVEEVRSPVILDVTASYSPDSIASQAAGGGRDGTIARGGRTAGFSMVLGREMRAFTIAGTAGTTYVGQQLTALLSNSTFSESNSYWNYDLSLTTQTRFSGRASLNAGVGYTAGGNYNVSNVETGNPHTYDAPNTLAWNIALNFHVLPNRLVGAMTYTYDTYTDAKNTFANPASDTAVQNRVGNVIGVRLMYVFN